VGRSPAELCKQIQDPNQNGGLSLHALIEHMEKEPLVQWAWNPGAGRTLPPLSHDELVKQTKLWIDGGAACPE